MERKRKQIHLNSQTIITLVWSRTDLCKDRCFLKERSSSYMCDQSKICIMPHVSRSIGALNVMYCTEIERNSCAASYDWLKPWKEITWYSYMIVLHMHVNTFYVWWYGVSNYNDKNFRWPNVTENVTEHCSLHSSPLLFHIKREWPNHRNNMQVFLCPNYSWFILFFSKPTR